MENNLIIVTDWERVAGDDFYLSYEWDGEDKENIKSARKLQKEGKLFYGYIVDAKNYAIYWQMDSDGVLIDEDCNVIVHCESSVINDSHEHVESYDI